MLDRGGAVTSMRYPTSRSRGIRMQCITLPYWDHAPSIWALVPRHTRSSSMCAIRKLQRYGCLYCRYRTAIPQGQGSSSARPTRSADRRSIAFTKNAYRDNVVDICIHRTAQESRGFSYRDIRQSASARIFWDIYGRCLRSLYGICQNRMRRGGRRRAFSLTLQGMSVSNRIMALFV